MSRSASDDGYIFTVNFVHVSHVATASIAQLLAKTGTCYANITGKDNVYWLRDHDTIDVNCEYNAHDIAQMSFIQETRQQLVAVAIKVSLKKVSISLCYHTQTI